MRAVFDMLIETLLVGAAVGAVSAGRQALHDHRQRRTERQLAEMQFRALLTNQEIHAKASAARRAMVEEVRRQSGASHFRGGGQ